MYPPLSRSLLAFVVLIPVIYGACRSAVRDVESQLATVKIERGNILVGVTATGTLEPVEVVDVGAQIVGQILELGTDVHGKTIDYGSVVEEGAVLLRIDDRLYVADARLASANLDRAKAQVQQAKAALYIAQRDWNRAQRIGQSPALSRSAYDTYRSNFEAASAGVAAAEAALNQAAAALERAELNVKFCTIRSPVKGTIIDKRVNIGQTVVSSFNAPSLFLIAKDLTKIQVWVSVNEADVTRIFPGQLATFTVDAFPGKEFQGQVNKIRLNASMVQNVVNYIVEVDTDNVDAKLIPYLTANVRFRVEEAREVLVVPVGATRFMPTVEMYPEKAALESTKRYLWMREPSGLKPRAVTLGLTDGTRVAVSGEGIYEGLEVVVAVKSATREPVGSESVNPFVPKPRAGTKS